MPYYSTLNTFQFFPGESTLMLMAGANSYSSNVPADYYSDPERYGYSDQPSPWGYTEERRASLAFYDYRTVDESINMPEQLD